ncbi:ABC transporter ATP-binding protein [Ornithinimicrobium sufpigmenti]|uniref:ABC transporter ATP-binding protein n=1 Tax=Ornithinimicrobium sufpigmenti TaxID=2508882 RepID=UPI0010363F9B|nr:MULTISPECIES: ABC transporter ATP-binding protein [unclassified Ornithinimicrobium]
MRLELTDVHAGYGRREVLFGISMAVEPGSITVMLGTNGAGKSTTLKTIMGAIKPTSGSITYDGRDTARGAVADNVAHGMAAVPEAGGVFRDFTVRDNLLLGAFTVKDPAVREERLESVYELFPKLRDRVNQSAATLSGGERQMLAIGRALMSGPSCLMLDEPFLGLAPVVVDDVVDSLATINRESGVTLLVVEQSVRILDIATHAYVLRLGRIHIDEPNPRSLVDDSGRLEASFIG